VLEQAQWLSRNIVPPQVGCSENSHTVNVTLLQLLGLISLRDRSGLSVECGEVGGGGCVCSEFVGQL